MTSKKAAPKAKAEPKADAAPVANMGAGADEQNAKQAKAPSVEDRLSALEKAHEDHKALAARNGWSV